MKTLISPFTNNPVWHRFAKNVSIGMAGSIASIAIGLGRTALLTKCLSLADYGKILIVLNLPAFLGALLSMPVHDVLYRFYPRMKQEGESDALIGLLLVSLTICLTSGLIAGAGLYASARWISCRFYQDPGFASLFRIYAGTALLTVLAGVYEPILRLHDRFSCIVVSQILGGLGTVVATAIYLFRAGPHDLEPILVFFALGVAVRTLPPFALAISIAKPHAPIRRMGKALSALKTYRRPLTSSLFQAKFGGYLSLACDTGGPFLLGILSNPEQMGFYGVAVQFTNVFLIFQNNIVAATSPEISTLWAAKQFRKVYVLVKQLTSALGILGGVALIAAIPLARPAILLLSKREYLNALPAFFALFFAAGLAFAFLAFYPLALCMDRLGRRNLVLATGPVFVGLAAVLGMNAFMLALAQLAAAISTRLLFDIPLLARLRALARTNVSLRLYG